MNINPYLCFEGQAEAALDFYKEAIGADVTMLMRFGDMPDPSECEPQLVDKVMHATVKVGNSVFMVSDGRCEGKTDFKGISMSLGADTTEQAEQLFSKLADGGEITMPLAPMFWSPAFGMLTDRFGVTWMVNVDQPEDAANA